MDTYYIILLYLEIVNLLAIVLMGIDKHRAKTSRERIPEFTLMLLAVIGGSVGSLGGMYLFRHKTRKKKFTVGVPVILGMQIFFCLLLLFAVGY